MTDIDPTLLVIIVSVSGLNTQNQNGLAEWVFFKKDIFRFKYTNKLKIEE